MSESVVVRETREEESRAFLDIHRAEFGHADAGRPGKRPVDRFQRQALSVAGGRQV